MSLEINPNVQIDELDASAHIGVTCFPMVIDTVRFTPLSDKGREILQLRPDEKRRSTSRTRGYGIYDAIVASGYSVKEEILSDLDQRSKWDRLAESLLPE